MSDNLSEKEAAAVVEALKQQQETLASATKKIERQIESGVLTDSQDFGDQQLLTE